MRVRIDMGALILWGFSGGNKQNNGDWNVILKQFSFNSSVSEKSKMPNILNFEIIDFFDFDNDGIMELIIKRESEATKTFAIMNHIMIYLEF